MKTQQPANTSAPRSPIKSGSQHAKRLPLLLIPYSLSLLLSATVVAQDAAPSLPPLEHYARLWDESLFTTRTLPPPEAPAGPNFATHLTLTGTFEVNGKMAAVLIDKATSNVIQALIGEDNEDGIRITKVEPGATPDKMRIQLQKGREFGWVSFPNESDSAAANDAAGIPAQANGPLGTRQPSIPPVPQVIPQPQPGLENVPRALPADMSPQQPPASLRAGLPEAPPALPNDVPLPPQ